MFKERVIWGGPAAVLVLRRLCFRSARPPPVPRDSRYLLIWKSMSLRPCHVCSTWSNKEWPRPASCPSWFALFAHLQVHFAAPLSRLLNNVLSGMPFRCAPVAFAQHWSLHNLDAPLLRLLNILLQRAISLRPCRVCSTLIHTLSISYDPAAAPSLRRLCAPYSI